MDALQQLAGQPAGQGLESLVLYGLGGLTQLQCLGESVDCAAAASAALFCFVMWSAGMGKDAMSCEVDCMYLMRSCVCIACCTACCHFTFALPAVLVSTAVPTGCSVSRQILLLLPPLLHAPAAFPNLLTVQLGGLCHLASASAAVQKLALLPQLRQLILERINGLSVECLQQLMADSNSLVCLRVRGCDGVCEEDMQELAAGAAGRCSSSASVWWAASPSCDTDDEEDGWELLPA